MLIAARVLQGIGGGALQPIAQAILLESFAPARRGRAMAAYSMGVIVAPIMGPTLGGWITDSYSWRWIFYINLPVGLLALAMTQAFIEDPPYSAAHHVRRIDYWGLASHGDLAGRAPGRARQGTAGRLARRGVDPLGPLPLRGRRSWPSSRASSRPTRPS